MKLTVTITRDTSSITSAVESLKDLPETQAKEALTRAARSIIEREE